MRAVGIRAHADERARIEKVWDRIEARGGQGAVTFVRLFREASLAVADAADRQRRAGAPRHLLAGLPVSIKDLFDVRGSITTAGSRALADREPAQADAVVVARLRAAGAAIVGTTTMTELAFGAHGLNAAFGTPLNPYDRATGRIAGGSSSGAAVSVADGFCAAAIGTDTAGSVRVPAALCGLVGFKATAGRIPIAGATPLSYTLDSVGVIAASVASCAAIDAVIAGDTFGEHEPPPPITTLRLMVPESVVFDDLEPTVAQAIEAALARLADAGVTLVRGPLTELAEIPRINKQGLLTYAEAHAAHRDLLEHRRDLLEPETAERLAAGGAILASDYVTALRGRAELIARVSPLIDQFDALVMPAVPIVAPPLQSVRADSATRGRVNRLLIRNAAITNFLGRCAITLPCQHVGGAPVGLMLVGGRGRDRELLGLAATLEPIVAHARPDIPDPI